MTAHELPCVWVPSEYRPIPYDISALTPDVLRLECIAHGLANTIRYGGHAPVRYSVAMHSVFVSYIVPSELALEGLMHDAEEAYLGDLIRPVKRRPEIYPIWKQIAGGVDRQIRQYYYLAPEEPPGVKAADQVALEVEQSQLRLCGLGHPHLHALFRDLVGTYGGQDFELFMSRYQELTDTPRQVGALN